VGYSVEQIDIRVNREGNQEFEVVVRYWTRDMISRRSGRVSLIDTYNTQKRGRNPFVVRADSVRIDLHDRRIINDPPTRAFQNGTILWSTDGRSEVIDRRTYLVTAPERTLEAQIRGQLLIAADVVSWTFWPILTSFVLLSLFIYIPLAVSSSYYDNELTPATPAELLRDFGIWTGLVLLVVIFNVPIFNAIGENGWIFILGLGFALSILCLILGLDNTDSSQRKRHAFSGLFGITLLIPVVFVLSTRSSLTFVSMLVWSIGAMIAGSLAYEFGTFLRSL